MSSFTLKDYNNLVKDVKRANQRIQKLQGRYGESSWAVNQLYEKIDNKNINGISVLTGNIKINKNMSDIQLKAIEKATTKFLDSQTSTLRGVKKAISNMQDAIKTNYSDINKPLSDKDAEKLYSFLESKDTRGTVEKIGASETWTRAIQAKEENLSKEDFIDLFKNTKVNINDVDIREDLDCNPEEKEITEVNAGIYIFDNI